MATPTLYERIGGERVLHRLAVRFYEHLFEDPVLLPFFRDTGDEHAHRLGLWLTELLGGPKAHTEERGGFAVMEGAHYGLRITPEARARWVRLFRLAATEVGVDAELLRDLEPYLEGGSTFAMRVSFPTPERGPR